ncbi:MAG: tRNA (N6-isopentenyl adenosine(37)-C2)-methylthiotransferase MiaB [Deltaproteobacteria bacterium RIFOXYD12_FULL_50_9]|nr:MAG: tRNA (N6-isopentenyl adenosine(37)-C2)-methylthiotransferase MiaB [Deltaproteobacteria bacterium RIFOXYD12_FULL_50_9]
MLPQKHAYIETFGCQMNERDSEIMAQLLAADHYAATNDMQAADLIVINTCSIRDKAEQKAYSLLGRLRIMKRANPALIIAVTGCVAQQNGAGLLKRMPFVDLIIGPQNIYRLPELLDQQTVRLSSSTRSRRCQIATTLSPAFRIPPFLPTITKPSFKRFITIMQGCNNFCTYCVVPYTRGREISRSAADILKEINHLVDNGIKEVTLIGQNVNSYGRDDSSSTGHSFPELLRAVNAIKGLERIRFTTSHPKDLSLDLIGCFAELKKLCTHFHLPVQSGSNRILKRMNRKYSITSYLDKVTMLRKINPEITLTTDIIVGFPGETDADFEETMELIDTVRFDGGFSFKYSDRPSAVSAGFPDKVPEEIKDFRLNRLQTRQNEITQEQNQQVVGSVLPVMIEGLSKTVAGQWHGRTSGNIIVNFISSNHLLPGQIVNIEIAEAGRNSLRGEHKLD